MASMKSSGVSGIGGACSSGQTEAALQPAEHPPLRSVTDQHQAHDRLAGAGDDGLAAGLHLFDEPREL